MYDAQAIASHNHYSKMLSLNNELRFVELHMDCRRRNYFFGIGPF